MVAFKILQVTIAVVFVLGAMEAALIGSEVKEKFEPTDEEMAREIGQFLETVQSLFDPKKNMTEFPGVNGYCKCEDTHCRCCQNILWKEFCVVLEHHHHSDMLELSLKCGNSKIISHTFSGASVCLHLNDLRIAQGKMSACIAVTAKYWFIKKTFELGCFNVVENTEKMELAKVMKMTHEMAKQVEQSAIWIDEGDPIVAFPDVFKLFVAANSLDQPLQDPDQK